MAQKSLIFGAWGQSWPNGQNGTMIDLPSEYANIYMHNVRMFQGTDFEPLHSPDNNNQYPATSKSNAANIAFLYKDIADLMAESNKAIDIYIYLIAQGSVRLQFDAARDDFNVSSVGELADLAKSDIGKINAWMSARGKDYEWIHVYEGHGEGDSVPESASLVYNPNLQDFRTDIETAMGDTPHWSNYNVIEPPSGNRPFLANVNAAKAIVNAANPTRTDTFNTPITNWNPDDIHPAFIDTHSIIWDDNLKPTIRNILKI